MSSLYPLPKKEDLEERYIGKKLADIDGPFAVLDVGIADRNCQAMLRACYTLGVSFRAHVKTHKTVELTHLQVGKDSQRPVELVVSTLAELEFLHPFLKECQHKGRAVNVIYGLPVAPSTLTRLCQIAEDLGPNSISLLIDSLDALDMLTQKCHDIPHPFGVFVKLDTGNYRAGISPDSEQYRDILKRIKAHHDEGSIAFRLRGFYSHMGISYGSNSTSDALNFLTQEIQRCEIAATQARNLLPDIPLTIAVGATPTALAAQNLFDGLEESAAIKRTKALIQQTKEKFAVELHAGAYCVLDMQQLAARSRPEGANLGYGDIALSVFAEVASLYPHRSPPEALIACGCLCLGRESCRSYSGMGVVTPWTDYPVSSSGHYDPHGTRTGWIVNRIAQEHGLLSWEGPQENMRMLRLGEKVQIWPNHCCITAANFGFFLIVDGTKDQDTKDRVIDV